MDTAARLPHDTLLPRRPGGLGRGALLALLAHAVLIGALTLSVQWRSQSADVVSAELWAAVPQTGAPRAEAPPPTPPAPQPAPTPPAAAPAPVVPPAADAQIATEKARREKEDREQAAREREQRQKAERDKAERDKAEREKLERDKEAREAADKRKLAEAAKKREADERAEEKRLAEQREANLKRLLGQAGATGSPSATGTDLRNAAPSASYVGRLVAAIKPNIVFADSVPGNPAAEVEVSAAASGSIIARRLRKSSGNKDWDEAVLRAIDRTGTLPRDVDGRVPASIVISFRPQE